MRDVPSKEPPTNSIVYSFIVRAGLTREETVARAEKALDDSTIALAKRWAREDHAASADSDAHHAIRG